MSINAGTAMGYLDLDIKGFQNGIKTATQQLDIFNNNTATSGQKNGSTRWSYEKCRS